jgi:hypothetical protein
MKKFSLKKKIAAAAAGAAIIAGAGGAYAYWTTSGAGSGSASTGTNAAVAVSQVGTVTGLVPGGAAQPVDFKINNPRTTAQYVTTVTVAMTGVTGPNIDVSHPCTTGDFTLVQPNGINQDLPNGDTSFSPSGATLKLNNAGTNQDGCKNASVALSFTAA